MLVTRQDSGSHHELTENAEKQDAQFLIIVQFTKKQCMTEKCLHSGVLPYSMIFSWNLVMWVGWLRGWGVGAPASSICLLPQRFVNGNRGVQSILQLVFTIFLSVFSNKITPTILISKERRNLEIIMVGV